ncbi:MAG: helix-hairpin-helix domain-containing protein [bacterium]|nr:helix-hairpin-helix domain-containing protein [bacterium]
MKRLITSLQKHTGTTRSEALTVLSIALVVAAGTIGPWIFRADPLHEVATADRILALLDSSNAIDPIDAISTKRLGISREATTRDSSALVEITQEGNSQDLSALVEIASSNEQSSRHSSTASSSSNLSRRRPASGSMNINTASMAQLERLPGVGPATAQAIVKRRTMRPFMSVDDLMDIRGIGPKKLEKMRPFVSCAPAATKDLRRK